MDEVNGEKNQQMPPASVMTKLIFIMVWRKLIRNPNTYSSVLGIAWSLISPRYSKSLYSISRCPSHFSKNFPLKRSSLKSPN